MSENENQGLIIANTSIIRSFLLQSKSNPNLSEELQQTASNLSSQTSVPYKSIRNIWSSSSPPSTRPNLPHLFSGSSFILSPPKPREKSEELKARLKKLTDLAERKEYNELVKDITPKKNESEQFSSYKDQLGFGLHVVVTMFTGYLVGYATFRALFNHSPAMNAAGGVVGLIFVMFLETFLFIIRTSNQDLKAAPATSGMKKDQ